VFVGPDPNGVMLEVVAIETPDGLVIIHAMKIRREYHLFVEEKPDARTHRKARRAKRTDDDKPRPARSARHRGGPQGSRGPRYTHIKVRSAHH
jgi:hypothetical protein